MNQSGIIVLWIKENITYITELDYQVLPTFIQCTDNMTGFTRTTIKPTYLIIYFMLTMANILRANYGSLTISG